MPGIERSSFLTQFIFILFFFFWYSFVSSLYLLTFGPSYDIKAGEIFINISCVFMAERIIDLLSCYFPVGISVILIPTVPVPQSLAWKHF